MAVLGQHDAAHAAMFGLAHRLLQLLELRRDRRRVEFGPRHHERNAGIQEARQAKTAL